MALPPSPGAVQDSITSVSPAVADRAAGLPGAVAIGVARGKRSSRRLSVLAPDRALTARRSKAYSVPLVRPVTVCVLVSAPEISAQSDQPSPLPGLGR